MTQSLPPKSLVLYADDDPDDIELLKEAFGELSHTLELLTFSNGIELLEYAEKLLHFEPMPCLVILDINMPLLDGKQTLKKLRTLQGFEEVPVVLFSTSTLPQEKTFARRYHAGFVTKPLHHRQIHHLLDQFVEHCPDEVKQRINKQRGN